MYKVNSSALFHLMLKFLRRYIIFRLVFYEELRSSAESEQLPGTTKRLLNTQLQFLQYLILALLLMCNLQISEIRSATFTYNYTLNSS